MQFYVLQLQSVYAPECLIGIRDIYILEFQIMHLAEELRTVDGRMAHHHIIAVPNSRTATWGKITVGNQRTVYVPPRILAVELGTVAFQVVTALDAGLAVGDSYVL